MQRLTVLYVVSQGLSTLGARRSGLKVNTTLLINSLCPGPLSPCILKTADGSLDGTLTTERVKVTRRGDMWEDAGRPRVVPTSPWGVLRRPRGEIITWASRRTRLGILGLGKQYTPGPASWARLGLPHDATHPHRGRAGHDLRRHGKGHPEASSYPIYGGVSCKPLVSSAST